MNEAQAPEVADFFQLKLQYLSGRFVQPLNFLLCETQALDKLDVAERFRRGSCKSGGFGYDRFLDRFDFFPKYGTQDPQDRNGREIDGSNKPVDAERIDRYKDDSDQGCEKNIDGRCDKPFDVASHFLKFSQRLAASLVFKNGIRKFK